MNSHKNADINSAPSKITPEEIKNNMGYCGLICTFCHESHQCAGCKSKNNQCPEYLQNTCFHYNCCIEKNIAGCWKCSEGPCCEGIFHNHNIRNRVFVSYAKEKGIGALCEAVLNNQQKGVIYGLNKDYDKLNDAEKIRALLDKGLEK